jgi:hypothetical protein
VLISGIEFNEIVPEVLCDQRQYKFTYGEDYFHEFQKRANTIIGRRIHEHRAAWVRSYVPTANVLDYGCGYGVNAIGEPGWRGWDINHYCQERLEEHERLDPSYQEYDAVCLFDVLEHMAHPDRWLEQVKPGAFLFVVMPCWQPWTCLDRLPKWKHWKPGEHVVYASPAGVCNLLSSCHFNLLERDRTLEGRFGREDVWSFVFRKSLRSA